MVLEREGRRRKIEKGKIRGMSNGITNTSESMKNTFLDPRYLNITLNYVGEFTLYLRFLPIHIHIQTKTHHPTNTFSATFS